LKQSFIIGILSLIQIAAAFFLNIIVLRTFGINGETDAYIAAQVVPLIIIGIIISALNSVWLPKLSANSTNLYYWKFVLSKSLGQAFIISIILSIFVFVISKYLILFFFSGFDEIQKQMVFHFMGIFLISMNFFIMSSQLTNALRTIDKFFEVELINVIGSLLAIPLVYFFSEKFGLISVCYILLLKSFLIFVAQYFLVNCPQILIKEGLKDKKSWRLMKPVLAGSSIYKLAPLLDKFLLSFAPQGLMTIFSLSNNLISAGAQIIDKSVVMTIYVKFGKYIKDKDFNKLKRSVLTGLTKTTIISVFCIIMLILFKNIIIDILIILLESSYSKCVQIWNFIVLLIGVFYASPAANIAVNAQYAFGNTNVVVKVGILGFIISIILKLVMYYYFEITGLLIAISLHYLLNFSIHTIILLKRNEFNSQ